MKRTLKLAICALSICTLQFVFATSADAQAMIKFDKLTHDFGQFPETSPRQTCTFTYTNTGDKPLIIHQAVASCGCTVPEFTKDPVQPGEKGEVIVTYNGKDKFPGNFKKSITLRTNAKTEMVRLYIKGEMTEAK